MSFFGFFSLSAALAVSTLFLVAMLAAVWFLDRYDREPLHLVAGVFLWGGLVAPFLSVALIGGIASWMEIGGVGPWSFLCVPVVIGPIVEEALKGLAILLVMLLSRDFDNPTDGIVYGTAVGLGFAVTENALYGMSAAAGAGPAAIVTLVLGRTLFTAGVHALASSAFGGFAGCARLARRRVMRLVWVLLGLLAATGLHSGWNFVLLRSLAASGGGAGPAPWFMTVTMLYGLYLVVLSLFLAGEHRILKRELADEVALGVLPPWVTKVIPYYRRRIKSDWWASRRERTVITRLITRLAFRKHAVRQMPRNQAEIAGLEVVQLRSRIRKFLFPDENQERREERPLREI